MNRRCSGYGDVPPHDLPWPDRSLWPSWALKPERAVPGRILRCKDCDQYRRTKQPPTYPVGTYVPPNYSGPIQSVPNTVAAPAAQPQIVQAANTNAAPPPPPPAPEPEKPKPQPKSRYMRRAISVREAAALPSFADIQSALDEKPRRAPRRGKKTDDAAAIGHEYFADPDLVDLWKAVVGSSVIDGAPPANIVFFGPKGSGKSDGARWLAEKSGLPFTKIDAASMTDPESWFGTREVIAEGGVSVTKYIPSTFVQAVQQPGVVFIDEMNRVDDEHRNVLLPLTDGTGQVTNPLTGEVVVRHPKCFIIMAGNRGLQYTGTSAVDPAFTSRSLIAEFDYAEEKLEVKIAQEETGCDENAAIVFARFAAETRAKARSEEDFEPISTREVIQACRLVARGLSRDLAARYAIMNAASTDGGDHSVRSQLESIWNGVRLTRSELDEQRGEDDEPSEDEEWSCPDHPDATTRYIPAGTTPNGGAYEDYYVCDEQYCEQTSRTTSKKCADCGTVAPSGRNTICGNCGAAL